LRHRIILPRDKSGYTFDSLEKDLIQIIFQLLPGFFAAWLFYGLTAHPRRDLFERIVQALIFTGIVKVITTCFGWVCLKVGGIVSFGIWTDKVDFGWSMVFAAVFGIVISTLANRDTVHHWLREGRWISRLKITKKNSYPSEWFSAFQREPRWVLLHLKDGRRLIGWPEEWPNDPTGHFLIMFPAWVSKTGIETRMPQIHRLVIEAKLVEWIEQLAETEERKLKPEEIAKIQRSLVELHETADNSKLQRTQTETKDNGKGTATTDEGRERGASRTERHEQPPK
jgi:hypothetical protein